jgi:hypothetical protein
LLGFSFESIIAVRKARRMRLLARSGWMKTFNGEIVVGISRTKLGVSIEIVLM